MLKRITKITGLLVCAVSVISIVPVMATDIKKYDAQEGTIYSAKAKGTGIYIDGEINDNEEAQYFMTPGGKYNKIEDSDDGDVADDLLLNKYLVMDDGDTVVDVTDNYKVTDDNTRADLQDDVASTIRKKIKSDNDDRFLDSEDLKTATKFLAGGSGLSSYTYTLQDPVVTSDGTVKSTDTVYTDYAGNYVDADYNLGNLKVITTGGSVTFKNTEDTYEVKEGSTIYEYKAVISDAKYITDISDNIFRWADISIYKKVENDADSNYVNVTDEVGFGGKGYNDFISSGATSVTVLQKFSKTAASDDIDGIKYSKDSTIYFIADVDGNCEAILGKSASASASKLGLIYDPTKDAVKITGNDKAFCSAYYNADEGKVYAETLSLKSKNGFNYVDLGDTDSTESDLAGIFNTGGLVYVLDGGYIKAWDGDESFTKVYKVDGDMDHMSIGSKDLIILWNEDDELYTIIDNTINTSTAAVTNAITNVTVGWTKAVDGTWSYNKADGTKATGWLEDGSAWYYLKADGVMAIGWIQDGGTWYYLNSSGTMQTGWINDNETWYYCNATGDMLINTTVDGYVLGNNGEWVK